MSEFASGNVPGIQSKVEADDVQVWWAGRSGQDLIATKKILLDGSNTDSGNSPASTVRGGNIVALDDASGNAYRLPPLAPFDRTLLGQPRHERPSLATR